MKQPYLDKARSGRVLKMEKPGAAKSPLSPERAAVVRGRRDEVVARLVEGADSSEAAWDTLGEDAPLTVAGKARAARAEALLQAVHVLGVQIKTGRDMVEVLNGDPVPESWVERFVELHTQRLELRWKADAATFRYPSEEAETAIVASVTDEEVSKALGQEWPGERVQEAMHAVNRAKGLDELKRLCLAALVAAIEQRYGGRK